MSPTQFATGSGGHDLATRNDGSGEKQRGKPAYAEVPCSLRLGTDHLDLQQLTTLREEFSTSARTRGRRVAILYLACSHTFGKSILDTWSDGSLRFEVKPTFLLRNRTRETGCIDSWQVGGLDW